LKIDGLTQNRILVCDLKLPMNKLVILFSLLSIAALSQPRVIVHETFDNNNYGWYESKKKDPIIAVKDGKYYLEIPEKGWETFLHPYLDNTKDFSLEATFTQLDGLDNNGIGFIWGFEGDNINSFTFTTNRNYRIYCSDKSMHISDEWHPIYIVNPMGKENKLKVEQRKDSTHFYLNGTKLTSTRKLPWHGKSLGFVGYTKMRFTVDDFILANDIVINLPKTVDTNIVKENLGPNINTEYDELSPKITADGKMLYFGREKSPDNLGGVNDVEDMWISTSSDGINWGKSFNPGKPINSTTVDNIISVSVDNNTLLFHTPESFSFRQRTENGWSDFQDLGIRFKNEGNYLEGCLSPDGKAILFTAKLKENIAYSTLTKERDIYVCVKRKNGWSSPINAGRVLNSAGDEFSPFLSSDGRTLYFATNGRPGYGDVDIFMSKRIGDDWTQWTEPVNLGPGINTVGFDAYYTLAASGEYGYAVTNVNSYGLSDLIRFKLPKAIKPDPVTLILGKTLNAKTKLPVAAKIVFDDLGSGKEIGEAVSDPKSGDYKIALPGGKNYGYHASAEGYLSVNENLELVNLTSYGELKKDLFLVPIEIGESIQLQNVFFVQSKAQLKPESFLELDRLAQILTDNPAIEIELGGHTDNNGDPSANLKLSDMRVNAVKDYLAGKGINKKRITGKGYGGTKPLVPNDSDSHRQMNRRVEFKIIKK